MPTTVEERRATRNAKREKQRQANIGRAVKMHAARLKWEASPELVPRQPDAALDNQFHIGCSGWFYWHWSGGFYPEDLPTSGWFPRYADAFSTVELNAPFYSWPTLATVKTWLRQIEGRDFLYTVKVSELITHIKRFVDTEELVLDFGLIADLLGPHMGCFLFQLPPSVRYTPELLHQILSQLDHRRRNVLEFRHPSWWNEDVYRAFRANGTIFCSTSGPRLPDELIKTADDIYIRFHGPEQWYLHNYSQDELSIWADRIKQSKAKSVWAYFNNDRDGHATQNARTLSQLLGAA